MGCVNISTMQNCPRQFSQLGTFFPTNNREENTDMEMTKVDTLKEELMASNPEFRELAREHGRYEERLSELSALAYPNDEEQLEEVTLKKKKLALKDQMYSLMMQAEKAGTAH